MKLGRSLTLSFLMLTASMVAPGACGTDGLVGGTCRKGLSYCKGRCIDLTSDEKNCGQCGKRCDSGVQCIDGFCGGGGEGFGGFGPGGDGWGGNGNFGSLLGGRTSGGRSGGGQAGAITEVDVIYPVGGNGGSGGAVCSPPYDTADHCGSCNTVCVEPTPVCADVGNKVFQCQVRCFEPLVNCNNACVDLNSDSDNCGACGAACPSAICQGGKCIGAQAGHIVTICMNYREVSQYSQPTTLLGNAVFLPMNSPVKILAYAEYPDATVRARVDTVIRWAGQARGRSYSITAVTTPDEVNGKLKKPDFDVFLVYDQQLAPAGTLGTYGTQWSKTLESFSYVGGVIVVLDGNTGQREMGELLTNSALLPVSGETSVSRTQVYNRDPGDVIGVNVVSPFLAPRDSCVFTTSAVDDLTTSLVVTDNPATPSARRPLAVHRIAVPQLD
jgi:hypothetical protein